MGWINTKEKLPPVGVAVMIYDEGLNEQVSYGYLAGGFWVDYMEKERKPMEEVTHWYPIPEPPRKFEVRSNGQEKHVFQLQRRAIRSALRHQHEPGVSGAQGKASTTESE